MTLQELINYIGDNPTWAIFFFAMLPICALIAHFMGRGEGNQSPWRYFYSVLIYLTCVPGIFAIVLIIYGVIFENRSFFNVDVVTQILPILSMFVTLGIMRKNVDFDHIPGFGKLSGLFIVIIAAFMITWLLGKLRLYVFSYMPFHYLIFIFLGILALCMFGWRKLTSR